MKIGKMMSVLVLTALMGGAMLSAAESAATTPAALPETEESSFNWSKAGRFAMLYVPNLLADALDVVTVQFSVGSTFNVDVYVTHYLEFGWENTDAFFVGSGPARQYGGGRRQAERIGLLCFSSDDVYVSRTFGWAHASALKDTAFNVQDFRMAAYRDRDADFWAIGAQAGFLFGAGVEFHPLALADFATGLVGYDLTGDNWE